MILKKGKKKGKKKMEIIRYEVINDRNGVSYYAPTEMGRVRAMEVARQFGYKVRVVYGERMEAGGYDEEHFKRVDLDEEGNAAREEGGK